MTLAVALLLIAVLAGAIIVFKLIQLIAHRKLRKTQMPKRVREKRLHEPTLGKNPLSAMEDKDLNSDVITSAVVKPVSAVKTSPIQTQTPSQKRPPAPSKPSVKTDSINPQKFIVLYLKAEKDRAYSGYELLQTLLTVGMRYGKKSIFHRHEQKTGQGDILFSLASAEEPGTFDLAEMGSFSTNALALFFKPSEVKDPLHSYGAMLQTVNELIEELGGIVLDEKHQKLNKEHVMEMRSGLQQISITQSR